MGMDNQEFENTITDILLILALLLTMTVFAAVIS